MYCVSANESILELFFVLQFVLCNVAEEKCVWKAYHPLRQGPSSKQGVQSKVFICCDVSFMHNVTAMEVYRLSKWRFHIFKTILNDQKRKDSHPQQLTAPEVLLTTCKRSQSLCCCNAGFHPMGCQKLYTATFDILSHKYLLWHQHFPFRTIMLSPELNWSLFCHNVLDLKWLLLSYKHNCKSLRCSTHFYYRIFRTIKRT